MVGCTTAPTGEPSSAGGRGARGKVAAPGGEVEPTVDMLGLQRYLGLSRATEDLGYRERAFDTCQVGYGFSSSRDCRRAYFVSIHFQLSCRDSEGTVETTLGSEHITPLGGRSVKWSLKGIEGVTPTDGEGFGAIAAIVPASQQQQRLRLAIGTQFLYIRAGEISRIVTPEPWCSQ